MLTRYHAKYFAHELTRKRPAADIDRLSMSLFDVSVDLNPHQIEAAKGSIESTDKRGHKWQGPAELTLNQNGEAITGTLVFTPPEAGRVQVPITSGVVSKDSLTFSGQNNLPMASVEITFHGSVSGTTLSGTADMTSRSMILGPATETASLSLQKQ
jgi:hypothetical protein